MARIPRSEGDGCTGTAINCGSISANPRLGFGVFVRGVPVRGPVYRYAVADFDWSKLQGCFCNVASLFVSPRPRASPELGTSKEKAFPPWLKLEAWIWSFVEGRSLDLESLELGLKLLRGNLLRHDDWVLETDHACLPFVLIRTCLYGSLPTSRHSGVSLRDLCSLVRYRVAYGAWRDRLIPRVGMLELHWHLGGTSQTLPVAFHFGRGSGSRERFRLELAIERFGDRHMAGLGTRRAGLRWVPGRDTWLLALHLILLAHKIGPHVRLHIVVHARPIVGGLQ
uniref:Uncharacterized protein n=1 Tax=Ananas comosus var. bracteatus TaxID=296719 RepID=A0A6V7Q966_ANACO|nr:unnamed protein product [Ananas comosus var. bracteatus]